MNKINVLHVVAGDLGLGAARGALWLHNGLLEQGFNSYLLSNSTINQNHKNVISTSASAKKKLLNFIKNKLDKAVKSLYKKSNDGIFSSGCFGTDITKLDLYKKCDIINFHWINNGFINMNLFHKIDKPIVWTIRDMWPLTGGCHYAINCDNYAKSCGKCPFLNSHTGVDASRLIFKRKKRLYRKDINIVAISNWLADEAKRSSLLKGNPIRMIPNNYDASIFFPLDKEDSRRFLGLTTQKKVILVGSININAEWKGYNKFIKALEFLNPDDYMVCTFGKGDTTQVAKKGFEVLNLGFLHDDVSMRIAYNIADVFVAPSLLEAFGKTIVEAMGCGIPVVCFDSTGPKDLVEHKQNGYKAIPYSPRDLANGISWVTTNKDYGALKNSAISKALKTYEKSVVAKTYMELYKTILKK